MTLTGFDSKQYGDDILSIQKLSILLQRKIAGQHPILWSTVPYNDFQCIEFSNRLFSKSSLADDDDRCDFAEGVDPYGILAGFVNDRWIHTADNVVKYFQAPSSDE